MTTPPRGHAAETALTPAWRRALHAAARRPPSAPRVALYLAPGGPRIGSVETSRLVAMRAAALPLTDETRDGVALAGPPDLALAALARWLRAGAARWRDEPLDVLTPDDARVAVVERDAARPLGITTTAVHLIGHTADGRVWLQQRAADKATDPNRWDTLVGGLVSAGEALVTSLARETWEEAGLRLDTLRGLRHLGRVSLDRPVPEGQQVQHLEVFEAVLGDTQPPENRDGEVQAFACVTRGDLISRLTSGDLTLEAALAFDRWLHEPPPAQRV
jgi:8-oxo-dGTP pyrophosphatase MutT (NUDIX family)